ncbi:acyl-CoA dehydrogenase domain protein [Gordonia bronchialis DSM 43247]|uniref:Acyl-CoA dehydrogenase domain protein n=1 Tax=Gordonia bronchialis (strain ATCC 25592 / DSM 43247 / BCRC 13721 / JCM 3198 / KCTC 3076 / NBRC 16047 / NCTC 10667) TaxID=526226 RepID=D0L2N6_GORB4|nr:acyl-CoA dehydrogenase family protein [Gordonia bronchialis]ACY20011.1 acyl-CoA dehydrogenase domain protein [Gordonia bronchialis DSM 43247]MCC3322784.1 acyl-CoA dehydrogenase family protein [Gordonia bronchialis]QGS26135.1 acyl-CoA dehydrogenase [Gordonia bronchialis]UAK37478.1 acyl-CoA dehydrogenase family protein [Gordonia bronchialis]STQ62796.1 Acyl-CoA dehydrogenase fadE12 [Gordonia bronchialis]
MDFELSDEQTMLRDTVREVLTRTYDVETLRKVTDSELGWDKGVWKSLADIGILGLTIPEEDGGMGAGPVEFASVMTELGRANAPEPYLDSVLVPSSLVAATADGDTRAELLGGLASGELLMAFAHLEPGDRWPGAKVATTASGDTISGTKTLVGHGDCADKLVVSARTDDGIGLYLVDADASGVTRTAYRTSDRRRGAQFEFADAPATRLGSGDATQAIADAEVGIQTALCAEALGAMERSLDLTVEYLKTRKQFGVTLATFQTLTQRAADMYVLLELARSMSLYATTALASGICDPAIASRAKLQICRSGRGIGQEAVQMHGGIGMTAEYPVGHYLSRLTAISHTLGGADDHVAALANSVSDYDMVMVG